MHHHQDGTTGKREAEANHDAPFYWGGQCSRFLDYKHPWSLFAIG
jgi:hypothetical protein